VQGQEVVLDFAGVTSAVNSNRDPCLSLIEECSPHLKLLAAAAKMASPPLIVFPSSRLVYGKPLYLPVDEAHPTAPTNIYGVHKLAVEHYLAIYQRTRGVPYLIFRVSNPYGPRQPTRYKGYGILNYFLQLAALGEPICIFGDGSQMRDFMHVTDLMAIMLQAIATPACYNHIFNVGGPEATPLRAAAECIARAAGGTPIWFDPWPAEQLAVETGDYFGCCDKIARYLDLIEPIPSERGLRHALRSYREPVTFRPRSRITGRNVEDLDIRIQ
jgi:nucleoside-diphosphate-sugar epimerase